MLLPKFEEQIIGKKEGDSFEFLLVAKDAYGEPNPQAIVELPMNCLRETAKLKREFLQLEICFPCKIVKATS